MINDRELIVVILVLISLYKLNKRLVFWNKPEIPRHVKSMLKDTTQYLCISLVIYGLIEYDQPFYDRDDIISSRLGRIIVIITTIMFYHQLIYPAITGHGKRKDDKRQLEKTSYNNDEVVISKEDEDILSQLLDDTD